MWWCWVAGPPLWLCKNAKRTDVNEHKKGDRVHGLYSVSFWYDLGDRSPGGGVFVVQTLADGMTDAVNAQPNLGKRRSQWA